MSLISLARRGRILAFVAGALLFVPMIAEAAPGGRSFGSRSTRSQTQVAPTRTAPTGAAPMQRSTAPTPGPSTAAPAAAAGAQAARPSFARNMMMGLGAGLLGAGLFGMLSGAGFFSGLASFAGMLGFLLQIALIGGAIFLVVRYFRRRSQPQVAMAGGPLNREAYQPQPSPMMAGLGGGAAAARTPANPVEFELAEADFGQFERLLGEVQAAASEEDLDKLRRLATPEIVDNFTEEFAENARKGLIERSAETKLLQGDLAETWREEGREFATVAMRYSLLNALVERNGGKVVEGHATIPREATELWTFMRPRGGAWQLCGIQPAG